MFKPDTFGRKSIRQALKQWHQSPKLGEHPLAFLQIVTNRRLAMDQPYDDTPPGRGIIVRQLLQEAVKQIKPQGDKPDYVHKQWRHYTILTEQYINGRRALEIRDELGISESGYFTDQRAALTRLGEILQEWEITAVSNQPPSPPPPPSPSVAQAPLPTPPSPNTPVIRLPAQPTPFIGRQAERQQLAQLLNDKNTRLITLAGPGGMGKTRLAVKAANEQSHLFAHGVYFIPLENLTNPNFLVPTVAKVIDLTFNKEEDPHHQLINFLRQKQILLIMDNYEHLMKSTPLLADLISHAPHLKIVVTSRERLNLRGEWVIDLRGMKFPEPYPDGQAPNPHEYSAVQLFLECSATEPRWHCPRPN